MIQLYVMSLACQRKARAMTVISGVGFFTTVPPPSSWFSCASSPGIYCACDGPAQSGLFSTIFCDSCSLCLHWLWWLGVDHMVSLCQHQYIMEMKYGGGVMIREMKSRKPLHSRSAYLSGTPFGLSIYTPFAFLSFLCRLLKLKETLEIIWSAPPPPFHNRWENETQMNPLSAGCTVKCCVDRPQQESWLESCWPHKRGSSSSASLYSF